MSPFAWLIDRLHGRPQMVPVMAVPARIFRLRDKDERGPRHVCRFVRIKR